MREIIMYFYTLIVGYYEVNIASLSRLGKNEVELRFSVCVKEYLRTQKLYEDTFIDEFGRMIDDDIFKSYLFNQGLYLLENSGLRNRIRCDVDDYKDEYNMAKGYQEKLDE